MPRAIIATLVLLSAIGASPAAAAVPHGPGGLAFYTPPSPLPAGKHGAAIRARPLRGAPALEPASRNVLLLYRSTGSGGRAIAVSGTVAVPRGRAPKGGWPVIAYGHGTTGIADQCAPTRDRDGTAVHPYNAYAYPLLERWLKAGYAVVRTDYQGLGTPGTHEYLDGLVEGRSMLDAVRAARRVAPLARRVVIAGHSQGGHAALWAAALAPRWTPELKLRGTYAFAPASHLGEQASLLPSIGSPLGGLGGIAAMVLRGLDDARPQLKVALGLGDRATALYPRTLTDCLPELNGTDSFGGLTGSEFLKQGVDATAVIAAIGASDPEALRIRTPVRIAQGTADGTVLPVFTDQLVTEYRARGNPVVLKSFPDVTHGGVVDAAAADSLRWLRARLGG